MTQCARRQEYLDRRLAAGERAAFEAHLERCPECREEVALWRGVDAVAQDWRQERVEGLDARRGAERLMAAARSRAEPSSRPGAVPVRWALAAAAAVAIVVCAWLFLVARGEQAAPEVEGHDRVALRGERLGAEGRRSFEVGEPVGAVLETSAGDRVRASLGERRLGLARASRVRIARLDPETTRLELERGTVALSIPKRAGSRRTEVGAGRFLVTVVGTVFAVTRTEREGLEVAVRRGAVEVTTGARARRLVRAGRVLSAAPEGTMEIRAAGEDELARVDLLLGDATLVEGTGPAPAPDAGPLLEAPDTADAEEIPRDDAGQHKSVSASAHEAVAEQSEGHDIEQLRRLAADGRCAEAEQALTAYIGSSPGDAGAWSLLADCRRKSGRWEEAVAAYRRVIGLGHEGKAQRARFMAGSILQDRLGRHAEAATLFEEHIAARPQAEAMVRLARSLIALGRAERARSLLDTVVAEHSGASAAVQARRLLKQLDKKMEGTHGPAPWPDEAQEVEP